MGANLGFHFNSVRESDAIYLGVFYDIEGSKLRLNGILNNTFYPFIGIQYKDFKFGASLEVNVFGRVENYDGQKSVEFSLAYESFCADADAKSTRQAYFPRF